MSTHQFTGMANPNSSRAVAPVDADYIARIRLIHNHTTTVYFTLTNEEYGKDLMAVNSDGVEFPVVYMDYYSVNWWERGLWKATVTAGSLDGWITLHGKGVKRLKIGTGVNFTDTHVTEFEITKAVHLDALLLENNSELTHIDIQCDLDFATSFYVADGCPELKYITTQDLPKVTTLVLPPTLMVGDFGDIPSLTTLYRVFKNFAALTSVTMGKLPKLTSMEEAFYNCTALTSFIAEDMFFDAADGTATFKKAFTYCASLIALPAPAEMNFKAISEAEQAWSNCTSLTYVPAYDYSEVTNFSYGFYYGNSIVTLPTSLDFSKCTSLYKAWYFCYQLTYFCPIDTSSCTNMSHAWRYCYVLDNFPLIDVSSTYYLSYTWASTKSITVPLLDLSTITWLTGTWQLTKGTTFPALDVSNVIHFNGTWKSCYVWTTGFPTLNFASATDMVETWANNTHMTTCAQIVIPSTVKAIALFENCTALTTVSASLFTNSPTGSVERLFASCIGLVTTPALNTSAATSFKRFYRFCSNLVTIGTMSTQSSTTMEETFAQCYKMTPCPAVDISSATTTDSMLENCEALQEVPTFATSNVTTANRMYAGCINLETIKTQIYSSLTSAVGFCQGCTSMVKMPSVNMGYVTTFEDAWRDCHSLYQMGGLNAISCTNVTSTWENCYSLQVQGLYTFPNLTALNRTYAGTRKLYDVPSWVTNSTTITDITSAFFEGGIRTLSSSELAGITNLAGAFKRCRNLSYISLTLPDALTTTNMFKDCTILDYIGDIDLQNATAVDGMFANCTNIYKMGNVSLPKVVTLGTFGSNWKACVELPNMIDLSACTSMNNVFVGCSADTLRRIDFTNSPTLGVISADITNPTNATLVSSSAATTGGTYVNFTTRGTNVALLNFSLAFTMTTGSNNTPGSTFNMNCTPYPGQVGHIKIVASTGTTYHTVSSYPTTINMPSTSAHSEFRVYACGVDMIQDEGTKHNETKQVFFKANSGVRSIYGLFEGLSNLEKVVAAGSYEKFITVFRNCLGLTEVDTDDLIATKTFNLFRSSSVSGTGIMTVHLSKHTEEAQNMFSGCSSFTGDLNMAEGTSLYDCEGIFRDTAMTLGGGLAPSNCNCIDMYRDTSTLQHVKNIQVLRPTNGIRMFNYVTQLRTFNRFDGRLFDGQNYWVNATPLRTSPSAAGIVDIQAGLYFPGINP